MYKSKFIFKKKKKEIKISLRAFFLFQGIILIALLFFFSWRGEHFFKMNMPQRGIYSEILLGEEIQEEKKEESLFSKILIETLDPYSVPVDDSDAMLQKHRKYKIKTGDTIWFIAKKFSVKRSEIIELNQIKNPKKLRIGSKILIPRKPK